MLLVEDWEAPSVDDGALGVGLWTRNGAKEPFDWSRCPADMCPAGCQLRTKHDGKRHSKIFFFVQDRGTVFGKNFPKKIQHFMGKKLGSALHSGEVPTAPNLASSEGFGLGSLPGCQRLTDL